MLAAAVNPTGTDLVLLVIGAGLGVAGLVLGWPNKAIACVAGAVLAIIIALLFTF